MHKFRFAVIAYHPIQYQSGIWREIDKLRLLDTTVLYCDTKGVTTIKEKEIGVEIKWDIDLLSDYKYKFLKNLNLDCLGRTFSRINYTLPAELYKGKYEVVLIHGYENVTSWISLLFAKLLSIKTIWRGEAIPGIREEQDSLKLKVRKIILKCFFSLCDVVMYSCSGNKKYLEFYGVKKSKLFPIPCSVDNDFFQKERERLLGSENKIRKRLGLDSKDFVALFLGRFTKRKRPIDIIEAVRKIPNDNITLLFVGDGPLREEMKKLVADYDLKAVFPGFQNQTEIIKYYLVSDVMIIPSEFDPSPKVLNEAMNFELPVIISNMCGTASDLVVDNGYIIDVGDITTLADKIKFLNNNRESSKEMGSKSSDIVKDFNFSNNAKEILTAVEFACNN